VIILSHTVVGADSLILIKTFIAAIFYPLYIPPIEALLRL